MSEEFSDCSLKNAGSSSTVVVSLCVFEADCASSSLSCSLRASTSASRMLARSNSELTISNSAAEAPECPDVSSSPLPSRCETS